MRRRRLVSGRFLTTLCGARLLVPVLGVLLALSFLPVAFSQDVSPSEAAKAQPRDPAAVVLDGATLFNVTGDSAFTPEERATAVVEQLTKAAQATPGTNPVVEIREDDYGPALYANGVKILVVTTADAEIEGFSQSEIAWSYRRAIETALVAYSRDRSEKGLERSAIEALLWTIAFGILIFGLFIAQRILRQRVERTVTNWTSEVEMQSGRVIKASSLISAVRLLIHGPIILLIIISTYFYFAIILYSFAYTRNFANLLLNKIAAPLIELARAAGREIPEMITLVVIILLTRYFLKLARAFFENIENGLIEIPNFDRDWIWPTYRIFRALVIVAAIVVAYPYIPGSHTAAFQGIAVLLGAFLSFGSNSVVSNLLSGLFVIYRRSVNIGDRIQVGELVGRVESVSLLETQLRSDFNELISIPNTKILNSEVRNFSRTGASPGLIVTSVVGIGYDEPQDQIARLLIQAAKKTKGIKAIPEPTVHRVSLNRFDISYRVNAYAEPSHDPLQLSSDLNANVVDILHGAGVQIMTPAYMADPVETKIPKR